MYQRLFYILFAGFLGFLFPLFESGIDSQNLGRFSFDHLPRVGEVRGVKVSVLDGNGSFDNVDITLEPEPVSIPGGEFYISAKSAIVIDGESGNSLFQKNIDRVLPIASITKLATALVVLESKPDWSKVVTMQLADEAVNGAGTVVYRGDRVTVRDLWFLTLVRSDNNAAKALARSTGMSEAQFVDAMNQMAVRLSLERTRFVEPTGLSASNVSTVSEVAKLLEHAIDSAFVHEALLLEEYTFRTLGGRTRKVSTTNKLLQDTEISVLGAKTGYTDQAGGCLVSAVLGDDGHLVYIVVLGTEFNGARFDETKRLAEWTWSHWEWPE